MPLKTRGYLLIGLAIALIATLTWFQAYRSILFFSGIEVSARVQAYQPSDPSGQSDWIMTYEFTVPNVTNTVRTGTDRFARMNRPPEGIQSIRIKYLAGFPAVSGVVGNISPTGLFAYAMAVMLVSMGVRFIRSGQ
jgi:hypothetical protein